MSEGACGRKRGWDSTHPVRFHRLAEAQCTALVTTIDPLQFSLNEMPNPAEAPAADEPASYEDALTELERLVQAMEGGQLPLDRLLESYQRGARLLAFCRARLQAVEQQVKVLEDGQLEAWNNGT
jgi:exodeoxyribonuclease VII small subunit